jgi:hypothetical protein
MPDPAIDQVHLDSLAEYVYRPAPLKTLHPNKSGSVFVH